MTISRRLCVSSSVVNFKNKLMKHGYESWHWFTKDPTLFFGMYHVGDYLRFLWTFGEKTVFWCGSDVLNLKRKPWKVVFSVLPATHICENDVEERELYKNGITASIKQSFAGNVDDYSISFTPSKNPHIWMCMLPGRENEYGLQDIIRLSKRFPNYTFHIYGVDGVNTKNIIFHGRVSEKQLDEDIKRYQCGLRLNLFDGFSEVLAKSVLLGQYPISMIKYKYIDYAKDIRGVESLLKMLKDRKVPNKVASDYWRNQLKQSI